MSTLVGGTGKTKTGYDHSQNLADQVRSEVEEKMGKFTTWNVREYKIQVVSGSMYFIKVKVDDSKFLHLKIYHDLKQNVSLEDISVKDIDCEITYF